jgi:hypothetical protein
MGTEQVLKDLILPGNLTEWRVIMLEKKVIAEVELKRIKFVNGNLNLPGL